MRQCGHSKSANSTTVTGALSGPRLGEPARGKDLHRRRVEALAVRVPQRLLGRPGAHPVGDPLGGLQARCARSLLLHALSDGDGHVRARRKQLAHQRADHWRRSRGVMALVSTPGSDSSFTSPPAWAEADGEGSLVVALESRQLEQAATTTRRSAR